MEKSDLFTAIAVSTGVASLWPIGHAAFMSWPSAEAMSGGNGLGLAIAYLFGVIGCAGLVAALTMLLLRAAPEEQ